MLRNYLLTGFRNLKRNRVYALLNIIGLALGIGCALVIFKVIDYEISYDQHHQNYENIYRVVSQEVRPDRVDFGMGVPHPLAPAMKSEFPEVKEVVRTHYVQSAQINTLDNDEIEKKFLVEEGIVYSEPAFFEIFDVEWLAGNPEMALARPNTAVITASVANQFFGLDERDADEAVGRVIQENNRNRFEIVGVIRDFPGNTNLPFKIFLEYFGQGATNIYFQEGKKWNSVASNTNAYFLGSEGFSKRALESKLPKFVEKYHGEGESEERIYSVQSLSEVHYSKDYESYQSNVPKQSIYGLALIALFLVLTACINFINLATAQAANRSKEVGIRKAIGVSKYQLVVQFFAEVLLITLIASVISLAIGEVLFIYLEEVIGYRLTLFPFNDLPTIAFFVGIVVIVTFLSAAYPSFLLSRMNTVMALKNKITVKQHSGGLSLRKGLVIFQFAISQFMIIGTLVIIAQMDYFLNKELGFETEAIILTPFPDPENATNRERLKQELLSSSAIQEVTFSLSAPTGTSSSHSNFNYAPLKSEDNYQGNFKPVDASYTEFYDISILAGRNLLDKDSSNLVVINRKIADLMGFQGKYDEVLGEKLSTGWNGEKRVVGVMENFHTKSLHEDLDYVLLMNETSFFYELAFKTTTGNYQQAIDHFEKSWEVVFPQFVSSWAFYDEQLADNYESERSISALMKLFSLISIAIGCLGLYGLISFIAQNKMKEIGVRKVLGASVFSILSLFSREIIVLMMIAFVLASPVAYWVLKAWLEDFKFSIGMGPGYFGIALLISAFLALATISHRTISSAMLNPARTLKDE